MPGPQGELARNTLRELALEQNGLVSRRQAIHDLSVHPDAVKALVARGRLLKVAPGIYRYPHLPGIEYESLQVALLRTGDPTAALSHETALALYELSDVNPSLYHVTVPVARRSRRADDHRYVTHVQTLTDVQVTWWNMMRAVTPAVAVEQCIAYGTPTYLLQQAIEQGARSGDIRRTDVTRLTHILETR